MTENLETKTKNYDAWNLLNQEVQSKCCEGKTAKTVMYDHVGAILAKCAGCGITYWHDYGAGIANITYGTAPAFID